MPHNRQTSRRITAMGFVRDKIGEGLWMSTAGGELSKSAAQLDAQVINIPFDKLQIKSGGYGILDVAFLQNSNKAWAVGGGQYFQRRTRPQMRTRWVWLDCLGGFGRAWGVVGEGEG